jgi:5,10-methylenetetrahydromethanopterin reductase
MPARSIVTASTRSGWPRRAEAYPWWRKHAMEGRSATAISPLIARETQQLTIGWGIISPFTRHPIQVAMDARVTQEAAAFGSASVHRGSS